MKQAQQSVSTQEMINELKTTVANLSTSLEKHEKRIKEFEKLPVTDETKQMRFNALLSEMQNADQLVENHSRVSLVVSTGLLAFATTEVVVDVPTYALVALGAFVIIIWCLKIYRHKQIFDYCHKKLGDIQKCSIRPAPKYPWTHGFTLMYALVAVIIVAWLGVVFLLDEPESRHPDPRTIEEKLSYDGSQLDDAFNQTESVKENVDKLNLDTKTANKRLDKLETELQEIYQKIEQKQHKTDLNTNSTDLLSERK